MTTIWDALGFPDISINRLAVSGDEFLPSYYPVTDLAVATIGAACLAVSELIGLTQTAPKVSVDRRLASLWFGWSLAPIGWEMASAWDPIAGDYEACDGWIRLHTNAPHHRAAAMAVLQCAATREAVTMATKRLSAHSLETAIIEAGGCAATLQTSAAWACHPQGIAVAAEPLIAKVHAGYGDTGNWQLQDVRPLAGLRVLDLTRVLAGPVATRFLAGYGADVLRIDPPLWDEPGVIPEVTLGKRCIRLDLRENDDRARFEALLAQADVLVHGYRTGALDKLGYDAASVQSICPGLIDVSLNAYGHSGPWSGRRGFDSLVQMSTGIAEAGMAWKKVAQPYPLPVQALDHATGYLAAAAVIRGLYERHTTGRASTSRLSLARTAKLLADHQVQPKIDTFTPRSKADLNKATELTSWGPAQRITPSGTISGFPMAWDRPATALGSGRAEWLS
jgi:CoA-transferase family III